jgi:hypothetical protein
MRGTELFSTDSRELGTELGSRGPQAPSPIRGNLWKKAPSPWIIAALLAAWLTYPTIGRPASAARLDTGDGRFSIWNIAWVAHALITDPAHLFDANIFHPHQGTLAYSEANLVAGVMAVPVYALTRHPVAAHNSVVFAVFVLSFVAMWALARRLTSDPIVAYLPATAFTFAPFVAARTAHIQLLMVFVFPVTLLAWHRFLDAPGPRRGVVVGLALALAALSCGYYGIFAGMAIGLAVLWFAPAQPRPTAYWSGVLLALVVAAAIVAPVLHPYLELRAEAGARRVADVEELRRYSADWRAYLTSPAHAHAWIRDAVGLGREVLFPGIALTLIVVAGATSAWRRRGAHGRRTVGFYVVLGALAAWASFGPDAGLYAWLNTALPFMSFLRAPARLGIVVVFCLAVLAAFALARLLPRRRRGFAVAALVVITALEVSAAPWPLQPVPPLPAAYARLRELPRAPVVELHFAYRRGELYPHTYYMFWSAWHWHPLVNGYSDHIPRDFLAIAVPINGFPDPASFDIARERHVRYVLIHWSMYDAAGRVDVRERFRPYSEYIRPLHEGQDISLFEIVGYPPRR